MSGGKSERVELAVFSTWLTGYVKNRLDFGTEITGKERGFPEISASAIAENHWTL
ncbi:hypothetical protein H6F92_23180 [Microcystis wesenbergii FACHB-1317]|uniref:hypothetical protein n=1 Tax=Microcystis TaxID=1125 RepID=UPI001680F06F|nr:MULTISPECIES: hypothetical protein [Microcystis]NCQ89797.1 hypothetical protein [Microcystis aeruginosa LG13-13]NCR03090.1 hypothetical protein [Microcystis aeruginosa LG13-03]NCR61128.1 hypothetical protein [Microcystis aeruginosa LG11-05]MBD2291523.1 hypothetical protein [Microcystis wesenbergii FACHB-1317]UZO75270.1 hypothetical protein M8120_20930 [Microcystis aeruginosa str. Chao 1910]